jgi:hypothetical protein
MLALVALGLSATAASAAVATFPAQEIQTRTAKLGGTASSDETLGCFFRYQVVAPRSGAFSTTPPQPCNGGGGGFFYTDPLGLPPGSTINYQAMACRDTNGPSEGTCGGSVEGSVSTFTLAYPTPTTGEAQNVRGTSATITGTIDRLDAPEDFVSTVFRYSTDPTLFGATDTPLKMFDSPTDARTMPVSEALTQLSADTTYYYALVARSRETDVPEKVGAIRSFRTGGGVRTTAPVDVEPTAATLTGEVNAGDADTTAAFEYARTPDFAGAVRTQPPIPVSASEGTKPVRTRVTGLSPGTTYYVRVVAGALRGAAVVLQTPTAACPAGFNRREAVPLAGTRYTLTGCWKVDGTKQVSTGTVLVNGVSFVPGTAAGSVTLDTAARRFTTSEGFQVSVRDVRLRGTRQGRIDVRWEATSGELLISGAKENDTLRGFPLLGGLRLTPAAPGQTLVPPGGSRVTMSVVGPAFFGITGEGAAIVEAGGKLRGFKIQLGNSSIGPINLPGILFENPYTDATGRTVENAWRASVNFVIPGIGKGLGASIIVQDNVPKGGSVDVSGINAALGSSGAFLQRVFASLDFTPPGFEIVGAVGLTAGPKFDVTLPAGTPLTNVAGNVTGTGAANQVGTASRKQSYPVALVGIDAQATIAMQRRLALKGLANYGIPDGTLSSVLPLGIQVDGSISILNTDLLKVGGATFQYLGLKPDPVVSLSGKLGGSAYVGTSCASGPKAFGVFGEIGVSGVGQANQFDIRASANFGVRVLCRDYGGFAIVAVTSNGIGACVGLNPLGAVSAAIKWKNGATSDDIADGADYNLSSCGAFDKIKIALQVTNPTARSAQAGGVRRTVQFDSGDAPLGLLSIRSSSGVPRVRITSQGRAPFETATDQLVNSGAGVALPIAERNELQVQIPNPGRGRFTIEQLPGSGPITSIGVADGRQRATVRAQVRRRGDKHVLSWQAPGLDGRTLVIREAGTDVLDDLVRTKQARGSVTFTPTVGAGRTRRLTAQLVSPGQLAPQEVRLGRYTAPAAPRVRRPTGLRLVRPRRTVTVQFRSRLRKGERLQAQIALGDGRKLRRNNARSGFRITGVGPRTSVVVTLTGIDVLGRRGGSVMARTPRAR